MLCWVFVSARGLSPVAASGGHSSSRCAGLSPSRPLPLRSTGSRRAGSAAVAHGPSRSAACGILPDQGSNPCTPHRQPDSQPLRHQGSPGDLNLYMDDKQSCPNFALEGDIMLLYLTVNKLVLCTRRGYNLYLLRLFNFTNILEKLDWDKSYQCLCSQDREKHGRPMQNFLPASFPTFFGNFLF